MARGSWFTPMHGFALAHEVTLARLACVSGVSGSASARHVGVLGLAGRAALQTATASPARDRRGELRGDLRNRNPQRLSRRALRVTSRADCGMFRRQLGP